MKKPTAFKPRELLNLLAILLVIVVLAMGLASSFLFQTAQFIYIPFFFIFLLIITQYQKKISPIEAASKSWFLITVKVLGAFLLLIFFYFGFAHGLLLYQAASYDVQGQPVFSQFFNDEQLLWALKLSVMAWVIASGLALAMAALDKEKISQFFMPLIKPTSRYALVLDTIITSSVGFALLLFMSMVSVEVTRSVVAYAGYERPAYPELTAFILALFLWAGYYLFGLKKRLLKLSDQSVSVGRIFIMQTAWVIALLLLGQGFIIFFPQEMILPLAKPLVNIFTGFDYEKTWLYITLTVALMSAPLLARFLVRILSGLPMRFAALLLVLPLCIGLPMVYQWGYAWVPSVHFVAVGLENVVYRVGPASLISIGSLFVLLLCFMGSKSLQMAWVDLMPQHMGKRPRRLRHMLGQQTYFFMLITMIYLFFASSGYYFLNSIFLVFMTLTLLWVSLYLFYTLTYKLTKGR
ncbi:MAG: hypothetical protein WC748_01820 [Legionellales bacterium]